MTDLFVSSLPCFTLEQFVKRISPTPHCTQFFYICVQIDLLITQKVNRHGRYTKLLYMYRAQYLARRDAAVLVLVFMFGLFD